MSRASGLLVALLALRPAAVPAQVQVVVPNVYSGAEGPGSCSVPIYIQNNPWTFQLIPSHNQSTPRIGQDLTGISYRHSAVTGGGFPLRTTTWSSYGIRLGPSVAPGSAAGTHREEAFAEPGRRPSPNAEHVCREGCPASVRR